MPVLREAAARAWASGSVQALASCEPVAERRPAPRPKRAANACGVDAARRRSRARCSAACRRRRSARRCGPSRTASAGVAWRGARRRRRACAGRARGRPPSVGERARDRAARRRARGRGSRPALARPVDAAVLGPAAAEIAALREVLRDARRRAGDERRQRASSVDLRGDGDLVEHLARGVVGQDRHRLSGRRCRRRRASPSCSAASRRSRARRAAPPSSPARGRGSAAAASRAC